MNLQYSIQKRGRRHHVRISAEPMTAATRALLQRIKREVNAFAGKWKAHVAKQARKAKQAKGKTTRRRRRSR
jgi:hypothetical protein